MTKDDLKFYLLMLLFFGGAIAIAFYSALFAHAAQPLFTVPQGGTGAGIFNTYPIVGNATTSLTASSTLWVVGINATSTTASSTFAGGIRISGGGINVGTLISCDTIDTDSLGNLICGTDATGGGGGSIANDYITKWATSTVDTTMIQPAGATIVKVINFISSASSTIDNSLKVTGGLSASSTVQVSGLSSLYGGFISPASSTVDSTLTTSGALRSQALATFNAGINVNAETITDLTGTGLQNTGGALNVIYGSSAGNAAQGNITIVCPVAGSGLSGGGNTITIGTGGTCTAITLGSLGASASKWATTTFDTAGIQPAGATTIYPASIIASASSTFASNLRIAGDVSASSTLQVKGVSSLYGGFISSASSTASAGLIVANNPLQASSTLLVGGLETQNAGFISLASSTALNGLIVTGSPLQASSTLLASGIAQLYGGFIAGDSSTTTTLYSNRIYLGDGTVGVPALSFGNETRSGFYRPSPTNMAFTMSGTQVLTFGDNNSNLVWAGKQIIGSLGTNLVPTYSFNAGASQDTGIYLPFTDTIGFTSNGTLQNRISPSGDFLASSTVQVTGLTTAYGGLVSGASSTMSAGLIVAGSPLQASSTLLTQNIIAYASSTLGKTNVGNTLQVGGTINASSTATSTFANGIALSGGCFSSDGGATCLSAGGGSGTINGGTLNRLAYYTGATALSSANSLSTDGTNLGVATSSPTGLFSIGQGTEKYSLFVGLDGSSTPALTIGGTGSSDRNLSIGVDTILTNATGTNLFFNNKLTMAGKIVNGAYAAFGPDPDITASTSGASLGFGTRGGATDSGIIAPSGTTTVSTGGANNGTVAANQGKPSGPLIFITGQGGDSRNSSLFDGAISGSMLLQTGRGGNGANGNIGLQGQNGAMAGGISLQGGNGGKGGNGNGGANGGNGGSASSTIISMGNGGNAGTGGNANGGNGAGFTVNLGSGGTKTGSGSNGTDGSFIITSGYLVPPTSLFAIQDTLGTQWLTYATSTGLAVNASTTGAQLSVTSAGVGTGLDLINNSTGGIDWRLQSIGNVANRTGDFEIADLTTSGAPNALIVKSGINPKVGVATNTPSSTFAVQGGLLVSATSSLTNIVATGTLMMTSSTINGKSPILGTCTLVLGTCLIQNNRVTATSTIFLTKQTQGVLAGAPEVTARTAGVSFTITSSSATDNAIIAYWIIEPY